MRIGDAERDAAVTMLQEHHAQGRLTVDEFNERLEKALAAKVASDLAPLFFDLPSPRPGEAAAGPAGYGQGAGFDNNELGRRGSPYGEPTSYGGDPYAQQGRYGQPDPYGQPGPYGQQGPFGEPVPSPVVQPDLYQAGSWQPPQQPSGFNPANLWWMIPAALMFFGIIANSGTFGIFPFIIAAIVFANIRKQRRRVSASLPLRPLTYYERDTIMQMISTGNKVAAIKQYRQFTGADLYTARMTVEAMGREIGR